MTRRLVSAEAVQAARSYDCQHRPVASWQATSSDQAERIIVGFLLWLASTLIENDPGIPPGREA
jgi:hypothetical protein